MIVKPSVLVIDDDEQCLRPVRTRKQGVIDFAYQVLRVSYVVRRMIVIGWARVNGDAEVWVNPGDVGQRPGRCVIKEFIDLLDLRYQRRAKLLEETQASNVM